MPYLPFYKRMYYTYLGYLYWFAHVTTTRRFLGARISSWIKLLFVFLLLGAWIGRWGNIAVIVCALLLIFIYSVYWVAKRAGYYRFVPDRSIETLDQEATSLAPYRRVPVMATGVFSLQDWEKSVLLRPAAYWQVPRGDHAIMVAHEPQRYLYQFFNVRLLNDLQRGWLLFGAHPNPALAISFRSIWGPEFSQLQFSIFGTIKTAAEPKSRIIFLSFADADAERLVCQNIVADLQRHGVQL